jgi:hypothetical protein
MAITIVDTKKKADLTVLRTSIFGELADAVNALAKSLKLSQSEIITAIVKNALESGIDVVIGEKTLKIDPGTPIEEILAVQPPAKARGGRTKPTDIKNALDDMMAAPAPVPKKSAAGK